MSAVPKFRYAGLVRLGLHLAAGRFGYFCTRRSVVLVVGPRVIVLRLEKYMYSYSDYFEEICSGGEGRQFWILTTVNKCDFSDGSQV